MNRIIKKQTSTVRQAQINTQSKVQNNPSSTPIKKSNIAISHIKQSTKKTVNPSVQKNRNDQLNINDLINYGIPSNKLDMIRNAIENVVTIEMNDNEYMINKNIIFNAKYRQLKYFLQNQAYTINLINMLNNNDLQQVINYLMMYDYDVYNNDWINEKERLNSTIVEECQPNSNMTCTKCHNETVYTFSKQTKGGDEGETHFCKCCTCGHVWSES